MFRAQITNVKGGLEHNNLLLRSIFQDLDNPPNYFATTAGSYTEQLADAAVWEEKWFEHAAMIGRAMAEDMVILDQTPSAPFVENSNSTPVETRGEFSVGWSVTVSLGDVEPIKPKKSNPGKRAKKEVPKPREPKTEFECKHCNAVFKTKYQRWYHARLEHSDVQLQCTECGKVFPKLQHLENKAHDNKPRAITNTAHQLQRVWIVDPMLIAMDRVRFDSIAAYSRIDLT
eukprot:sb/3469447/